MHTNRTLQFWAILFLSLEAISCGQTPAIKSNEDTARISNTGGSLSGLAAAIHKDDAPNNWSYQQTFDKMTSGKTIIANCTAQQSLSLTFPYEGVNYPALMIQSRRSQTSVLLAVDKGQILERPVLLRFDDGKMISYDASTPGDGDSKYAFLSSPQSIVSHLKKAKHVVVEFELYDNGTQQADFDTEGLIWPAGSRIDSLTKQ